MVPSPWRRSSYSNRRRKHCCGGRRASWKHYWLQIEHQKSVSLRTQSQTEWRTQQSTRTRHTHTTTKLECLETGKESMTPASYQVSQKLQTSIRTGNAEADTKLTKYQQDDKLEMDNIKTVEIEDHRDITDLMDGGGSGPGSNALTENIYLKVMKIPGSSAKVNTRKSSRGKGSRSRTARRRFTPASRKCSWAFVDRPTRIWLDVWGGDIGLGQLYGTQDMEGCIKRLRRY